MTLHKHYPSIAGYRVLGYLGSGNMADVFRAVQVSLDRVVALKVLHADLNVDDEFRGRFIQEARAAARLDNPHIVACFDVGVSQGRYYIAYELVDGPNLDDLIENHGPLPEHSALKLAREVARGLQVAHQAGIIHRDLKADNILLTRDNKAKIADLGLAKDPGGDPVVSQQGMALGTPVTFSPEQARGRDDLDGRSDLYALGATLFYLLTGRYPFEADDTQQIMRMHLEAPVPDPRELVPEITEPTTKLLEWLLKKSRDERPRSAAVVVKAIDKVLSGEVAAGLNRERRKRRLTALAAVGLVGAAGLVGWWMQRSTPDLPLALEREVSGAVWERLAATELARHLEQADQVEEAVLAAGLKQVRDRYPTTEAAREASTELLRIERVRAARREVSQAIGRAQELARQGKLVAAWAELEALPPSSRIPPLDARIADEQAALIHQMEEVLEEARLEVKRLLSRRDFEGAGQRAEQAVQEAAGPVREEARTLEALVAEALARDQAEAPERTERDRARYRSWVLEVREHVKEGRLAEAAALANRDPGLRTRALLDRWPTEKEALEYLLQVRQMALETLQRQVGRERTLALMGGGTITGVLTVVDGDRIELDTAEGPESLLVGRLAPEEILDAARSFLGAQNRLWYRAAAGYSLYLGYLGDAAQQLDVAETLPGEDPVTGLRQLLELHQALFPEDAERHRPAPQPGAQLPEPEEAAPVEEPVTEPPVPEKTLFWTPERKARITEQVSIEPIFDEARQTVRLRYSLSEPKQLKDFEWVRQPQQVTPVDGGIEFGTTQAAKWTLPVAMEGTYTLSFRLTLRRKVDESVIIVTFSEAEPLTNLALNFGRGMYVRQGKGKPYQPLGPEQTDGLSKTPLDRELHLVLVFTPSELEVKLATRSLSKVPLPADHRGVLGFETHNVDFELKDVVLEGRPLLDGAD